MKQNQTLDYSIPKEELGLARFSKKVLNWIASENLWNIWVPKQYGGLELSFSQGLQKLKFLAKLDGSLGWCVTLCSGANYFIGNLPKKTADDIFLTPKQPVCFGGSGGLFGTAEKQGDFYNISGTWRYGTGAPYLTHFTLNAKITEQGKELTNHDGTPVFRSFIIPADRVSIIDDWNTMGLKATATCSFKVDNLLVAKENSFIYNHFQLPQPIFKINFSLFADLTLWANYIGMAEHLQEEAIAITNSNALQHLTSEIKKANQQLENFASEIEETTHSNSCFTAEYIAKVHTTAATSVKNITKSIVEVFPLLGVKAARNGHVLNQIFCDYFTATQHHIFTKS